jgi:DNA-binding NtrC family response regulator
VARIVSRFHETTATRKKRAPDHPPVPAHLLRTLEEVEREHIIALLEATGGNRTEVARVLRVDRKTLYRMLLRWGYSD